MDGKDEASIPEITTKRPAGVIVAEVFLVFIMVIYFAKICVLSMGLFVEAPSDGPIMSWNLLFLFAEVAMLFVTADSLMGLSSRRPKGWKKAARGAVLLLFFTLIGSFIRDSVVVSGLVTLNPLVVAPLVLIVMAVILLPSVRDYYVPPMESRKPLWAWIGFAAVSELYPAGTYRIRYDEEREYPKEQPKVERKGFGSWFKLR